MALGLPIIESIRDNIKTVLAAITAGPLYTNTVSGVFALTRLPNPEDANTFAAKHLNILVVEGDHEPVEDEAEMSNEWYVDFYIECYVIPSDTSTDEIDTVKNSFQADVQKCLQADHTRGGFALNSWIEGVQQFAFTDGSYDGFTVVHRVHYRTAYNDPYTQM